MEPGTEAGVGSAFARRFNLLDTTYSHLPLLGLGERSHLNSAAVDLSTHIADIVNLIQWEELSDVVLCGHSYAGCLITGVADQIPDRIRALVFLDAFVLENGESLMDIFPSEVARALREQAKTTGEGWKLNPSVTKLAFGEVRMLPEHRLNHSDGEAERFYRDLEQMQVTVRVGIEAGHALCEPASWNWADLGRAIPCRGPL